MVRLSKRLVVVAMAMALALFSACTPPSDAYDPERVLRIVEPKDGAHVSLPVQVRLASSVPLGEEYFVQVYVNGLEGPRVSDERFELQDLKLGDNAIAVSLVTRNGSPAGGDDSVNVTVTEEGG